MKPEKISMMDFAHHVIAVANSNNKIITNLQLQKIMYFTFKYMLNNGDIPQELKENYNDNPFLVWRYGPVVEDVYDEFSFFGANPILGNYNINGIFDKKTNERINNLLDKNVFDLVDDSHKEEFWKKNFKNISYGRSNIKYELDNIA